MNNTVEWISRFKEFLKCFVLVHKMLSFVSVQITAIVGY